MTLNVGLPTVTVRCFFSLVVICGTILKTQIKITPKKDTID